MLCGFVAACLVIGNQTEPCALECLRFGIGCRLFFSSNQLNYAVAGDDFLFLEILHRCWRVLGPDQFPTRRCTAAGSRSSGEREVELRVKEPVFGVESTAAGYCVRQ